VPARSVAVYLAFRCGEGLLARGCGSPCGMRERNHEHDADGHPDARQSGCELALLALFLALALARSIIVQPQWLVHIA